MVDGQLERLLESCKRIASALDDSRERSGALIRETAKLNADLESVEEKRRTVATFLVDYQLADEEIAALQRDAVDNAFFDALARVQEIHPTVDDSSARTTSARALHSWTSWLDTRRRRTSGCVDGCRRSVGAAEEDGEDAPELLSRAMAALRARGRRCTDTASRRLVARDTTRCSGGSSPR